MISNQQKGKKKQNGLVLLVLVIAIALAISTYYYSTISIVDIKVDNIEKTQKTLKKAKQALLAYAMNYRGTAAGLGNPLQGPGNFPCPDDDFDGVSDTAVGVVVPGCNSLGPGTMGRYPWATVQTEEYTDANGELLWYAVSSNFANQADRDINTGTTGGITLRWSDGTIQYDGTANNAIVAVILSPGKTLVRNDGFVQSRSTAVELDDPRNYLDIAFGEDNASFTNSSIDGFIGGIIRDGTNNVIVNDMMVVITYEEIMNLVHARVEDEVSKLLNEYFTACDAYPEASVFDPTKVTFNSEGLSPELRRGHLPINSALPINWGSNCTVGSVAKVAPILPPWLAAEGWHKTSYYAFSYENALHPGAPAADGSTCGNGGNPVCMVMNNTIPLINNVQALIIFAGRDTTAGNRPSNVIADYFEGENNDLDGDYDADEAEDYIRVITP